MDFGFIVKESQDEIDYGTYEKKKWYRGYISLFNLTIDNGTNIFQINCNDQLNEYINQNKRNLSDLNEEMNYNIIENNKSELCFVQIDFYKNGSIKDISIPISDEFNPDYMVYINRIINLIIPNISTAGYKEKEIFNKDLENFDLLGIEIIEEELEFEFEDEFEDEDAMENTEDNVDDFDDGNTLRRIDEDNDKNNYKYNEYEIEEEFEINSDYNNDDINNDITLKTENFNSGKIDANKIESKVLYENENHTQLIELEGGNLEDSQGKLEGSTLKRMKNTYISSSTGMLYMVNENENITIKQLNKESLKSLT